MEASLIERYMREIIPIEVHNLQNKRKLTAQTSKVKPYALMTKPGKPAASNTTGILRHLREGT